jgi:hypothetical protein
VQLTLDEGRINVLTTRYKDILKRVIDAKQPVPLALYVIAPPPEPKLVPIRLVVNFKNRKVELSLSEATLTKPTLPNF